MSGLAAVFHRDGRPVERHSIVDMLAAVPYRGPDGMCARLWESVALGHAKMAVTPEELAEQQPLVSIRTGCALVADVRLDNREALLARLHDEVEPSASDSELILRAYEGWGVDAVTHLLGDFALVIWDPRHRRMVCARDTSGQRSLFYRIDSRTFAAASEIQQLLQDPDIPIVPNEARIRDSLVPLLAFRNEQDRPDTYFEGILAVPTGHALVVDDTQSRMQRYWEFKRPAELRYRTDDEYAEHYRALFFEVVKARLRSAYPIGVALSGGLDSSSIACTAQQLYRSGDAIDRGFVSFSYVFDGLDCDEVPLIKDIQAHYGFDARYVAPGAFAGRLQLEPQGFRETPNLGIAEPRNAMFADVTRAGVRALLTGDIGDGCVYGSRLVFDSLLRRGDLKAFARHLRAYRRVTHDSLRKIVAFHCLAPLLPLEVQKRVVTANIGRTFRWFRPYLLPAWMPEALRENLSQHHLELCIAAEHRRIFANDTREAEVRLLYPPEMARHPVPWPFQMWRPFADRRLHEFLLAIPPEQKFEPHRDTDEYYAGSKQIVRRAMRGILPDSVRMRTSKTVFSAMWDQEIQRQWPVLEAAFGPSSLSEIAKRGYVDPERFWSRLTELREGAGGNDQVYLFKLLELETWLRALKQPREQLVDIPALPGVYSPAIGLHADVEVVMNQTLAERSLATK